MKKVVYLFCLFSVVVSCKQTQLTSKYNKRPNKINVKPQNKNHLFKLDFYEKKSKGNSLVKANNKISDNSLYNNQIINKKKLFADVNLKEIKEVSIENHLLQKSTRLDSILKSNLKNLLDEEDILKLSKKAKNFSLIGLLTGIASLPFFINDVYVGTGWFFLLNAALLISIGSIFLFITIKKIRKSKQKIKSQENDVKSNLKISTLISSLILLPLFIFFAIAIYIVTSWSVF